jgi:hypothetical protein
MTHMKKPGSTGLKKTKVTHQQSLFFSFLLIMVAVFMTFHENVMAENGYELWLRYAPVSSPVMLKQYRLFFREIPGPFRSQDRKCRMQ